LNSIKVNKKKTLTPKWDWQGTTRLTNIEIRYSLNKKNKWKTVTVGANDTSKKIKKLKKGKKYNFQIRGYKTVSGKKYYSSWSGTKTSGKVK
jgi:hypothetical protein